MGGSLFVRYLCPSMFSSSSWDLFLSLRIISPRIVVPFPFSLRFLPFSSLLSPSLSHLVNIFQQLQRIFVERVSWSLHWLAESAGVTDRFSHVYEIENLISLLASHANCPKSPYAINDLLQTSNYDHDSCTR